MVVAAGEGEGVEGLSEEMRDKVEGEGNLQSRRAIAIALACAIGGGGWGGSALSLAAHLHGVNPIQHLLMRWGTQQIFSRKCSDSQRAHVDRRIRLRCVCACVCMCVNEEGRGW